MGCPLYVCVEHHGTGNTEQLALSIVFASSLSFFSASTSFWALLTSALAASTSDVSLHSMQRLVVQLATEATQLP